MKTQEGTIELEKEVSEKQMEDELKGKYGKVYKVEVENEDIEKNFVFYFTKPSTASFNRALKNMSKKTLQAMKDFTIDNIIQEQKEEYLEAIEEYPALPMGHGQKLMSLLGVSDSISIKKL